MLNKINTFGSNVQEGYMIRIKSEQLNATFKKSQKIDYISLQ